MSFRLLVTTQTNINIKDTFYDCIITPSMSEAEMIKTLEVDFGYGGPHKIRIGNIKFYREVEPLIKEMFGYRYPDEVWGFYINDDKIEHPTAKELDGFLKEHENITIKKLSRAYMSVVRPKRFTSRLFEQDSGAKK